MDLEQEDKEEARAILISPGFYTTFRLHASRNMKHVKRALMRGLKAAITVEAGSKDGVRDETI
jgi:hypothetical protein